MSTPTTQPWRDPDLIKAELAHELMDDWSCTPEDIKQDEQGIYITTLIENGNPDDDYQVEEKKIYLDEEFKCLLNNN